MPAEASAQARQRLRRGPEHTHVALRDLLTHEIGHGAGERLDLARIGAIEQQRHEPRERRILGVAALGELLLPERQFALVLLRRRHRLDGGVFRRAGLHQHLARHLAAARPPRDLRQQLVGAFGRSEVGQVQRHVGIEHADQRDVGEVESLGDHLGAQQDVGIAARERLQGLAGAVLRARHVRVQAQHARAREHARQLALGTLRARAGVTQQRQPALGADVGRRLAVVAIVTAQPRRIAVVGERDIATRTLWRVAAAATLHMVRVATSIEPQQHLLLALESFGDRRPERRRQQAGAAAITAQIDHTHDRHGAAIDARRQRQALVLAARRVRERLQARRGRTQHDRHTKQLRAPHRDIATVIAQLLALLVGRLVLFVDHDQLQPRQRREHRAPCAHDDVDRTAPCEFPVAAARAHREVAVQRRDAAAEALLEHRQHLRRERDLGHEDQRLATGFARRARRTQIDLGLAARGDTVQQEWLESTGADRGIDRRHRIALRSGERDALGDRHAQHAVLERALASERTAEPVVAARERRGHDLARRREVVLRHPARELEQVRRQQFAAGDLGDVAHLLERRARDALHDHATRTPATEWHLDRRAWNGGSVECLGHAIREQLPHGNRQRDESKRHREPCGGWPRRVAKSFGG